VIRFDERKENMTIKKVEIERLSVIPRDAQRVNSKQPVKTATAG